MEITRTVGIAKMTVCRHLREGPPQRTRHSIPGKQRVLEPWEPYLLKRWGEGYRMATRLWRVIQVQGFACSLTNVQRFVVDPRRDGPLVTGRPRTALTQPHGPPPRQVAAIVLRRPERRSGDKCAYLTRLRIDDSAIATADDLAADFLVILRRREGDRLPAWLDVAETSGIDTLARFARKLRSDLAAV